MASQIASRHPHHQTSTASTSSSVNTAKTAPSMTTMANRTNRHDNPCRVLGIAIVFDQRGIGARVLARYPTHPIRRNNSSSSKTGRYSQQARGTTESAASPVEADTSDDEDIFFTLTPRQMAKLFRMKKTLCGQPVTLTVNGTVFCCRAILMEGDESVQDANTISSNTVAATTATTNTATSESNSKDDLELFSVIVALSSPEHKPSILFADNSFGGTLEDQLDLQRYLLSTSTNHDSTKSSNKNAKKSAVMATTRSSASFLSIRRVHLSLTRFCRALEREERRCQYVSLQVNQLFRIRNIRQKKWEEKQQRTAACGSSTTKQTSSNAASTAGSVVSSKSNQATSDRRTGRHVRSGSFSTIILQDQKDLMSHHHPSKANVNPLQQEELEKEQEILELMLASPPPESDQGIPHHHGNLVRELVQVFHSLSRNGLEFSPTPTALLSERDSVVYINQHIAIPIEAVSVNPSQKVNSPVVRPYYTLLFPHASPSELLEAFQTSGSAAPQRLQQLLLTVNPQKPLSDIAVDANLPLYNTMEIASYLVAHGACVTSPVITRSSRLACHQIHRIGDLALEFSQTFPNVDLFRLVSFLTTSNSTLGEAMSTLTNLDSDEGAWLRDCLAPATSLSLFLSASSSSSTAAVEAAAAAAASVPMHVGGMPSAAKDHSPNGNVVIQSQQQQQQQQLQQQQQQQSAQQPTPQPTQPAHRWVEEMEELLYAMAISLLSHRVLCQLQEYLVVTESNEDVANDNSHTRLASTTGTASTPTINLTNNSAEVDENLFRELLESQLLNGDVSITALCWVSGLDPQKLRSWGLRNSKVRLVSRVPAPGDDWGSEAQ